MMKLPFRNGAGILLVLSIPVANICSAQYITPRSQIEDFRQAGAAPATAPRAMTLLGVSLVMHFEGWRPRIYDDPAGLCTIGYGHLIAMKACRQINVGKYAQGLSEKQGIQLLELDTRTSRAAVEQLVTVELSQHEFNALSSFVFNVGKEKFANSTLLKMLNLGNEEYAIAEFYNWVKIKGNVSTGLKNRRACEAAMFRGTLQGNGYGKFRLSECVSLGATPTADHLIDIDKGEE